MNGLIIFDGIAPTYDFSNTLIVLGFEILTILVEVSVFYMFFHKKMEKNTLFKALLTIYGINLLTFFVGATIYTSIWGFDWLFTGWYYDYNVIFPAFIAFSGLISVLVIPFLFVLFIFWKSEKVEMKE